jgi:glycosyltransferase involved in cell wall biosynthesis
MAATQAEGRFGVILVNQAQSWGGGEAWYLRMGEALARRGWPVELLAHPQGELARRAGAAGLRVWPLALRSVSLLNRAKMRRLGEGLRARRPGALILNGFHEMVTAGVSAHRAGVPRVILRRGIPHPFRRNALTNWLLGRVVTRLIVPSRAVGEAMAEGFPELIERLRPRVIYSGVDAAQWPPAPPHDPTGRIAVVGRLEWEKGVDLLIQALHTLRQRMAHASLRIIGDGSERANLETLAAELGETEAVEFTGHTADVLAALRDCDVFALPSRWEGFSNALLEAMLAGLPVVAFDLPSAREIVVHGVTGLLAPEGDVDALAGALGALLGAPARARELGMAGRLRVLSQFTLEHAAAALEKLLLEPP